MMYNKKIKYRKESINKKLINISIRLIIRDCMKKITILSLHLGYGGAERCITNLANSLVGKYNVEILSVYKLYDKPAFDIDKRVNVRYLTDVVPNRDDIRFDLKHLRVFSLVKDFFHALKVLHLKKKRTIDAIDACDSDIIISSKVYFNKLLGEYKNDGVRAIGWEHNYNNHTKKEIKEFIKSCKYLDDVVMVNKELQEFYQKEFSKNELKCRVRYIPNYIDDVSKTTTKYDNRNLIAVGRLEAVKGFDDLIKVYKLVNLKTQGTSLTLVGDGKEKNSLFEAVVKNDLSSKVKMPGYLLQEDIDKLSIKKLESVIFDLTDNLGKKDITGALQVLQNLIYAKEPLAKILVTLYNHFKKLYITKMALNTNKDLASSLNLKPNQMFLTSKYKVQAKYFKEKDLRNMLQDLTDLDYNFKNGKIDLQVGMETILCRYCSN